MKKVRSVKQLKEITLRNGNKYPFSPLVHIDLDKKSRVSSKCHQIYLQQGRCYGTVGDRCDTISHEELFELEDNGMISIN